MTDDLSFQPAAENDLAPMLELCNFYKMRPLQAGG